MYPITIPLQPILLFVIVLARVGGLVTFAPFWSLRAASTQIRIMVALMLSIAVALIVVPKLAPPPLELGSLVVVLIIELAIGCILGFIGQLVFSSLELAAHIVSSQMGFTLAATINPMTRTQTSPLGTIAQIIGLMVMLSADGHHWLLKATIRSFDTISFNNFSTSASLAELLIRVSADTLAIGVALAAPAIVVMLAVEFAIAIAGRAAPQLQIMLAGFPIKILVGVWLIGASLYFLPAMLRQIFIAIASNINHVLKMFS